MPSARTARWGEAQEWARQVASSDSHECQMWPFKTATGETPRPAMAYKGRLRQVTSVVLELVGRPLADGQQANHTCDEPWCCNPRHLYAGSQHQNVRDAVGRGRMSGVQDGVVAEIYRLSSTMGYKRIAKTLGVTFYAARYHARRARKAAV